MGQLPVKASCQLSASRKANQVASGQLPTTQIAQKRRDLGSPGAVASKTKSTIPQFPHIERRDVWGTRALIKAEGLEDWRRIWFKSLRRREAGTFHCAPYQKSGNCV